MGSDLFQKATAFLDTLASQLAPAGKQAWALAAAATQVHAIASLLTSGIAFAISVAVFVFALRLFFNTLKNDQQGLVDSDLAPIVKICFGILFGIVSGIAGLSELSALLDPVTWVSAINGNLGLAFTILSKLGGSGG